MIAKKNKAKAMQKIFHVIGNVNPIVEDVIQSKNVIIKCVNVNVKIIINVKKIIAGFLAYVLVRIVCI